METETSKRPREDDDFEESKRQHGDPTAELIANICKDIRRIGESSNFSSQIDDISYISNPIVVEFEKIDKLRSAFLNTLNALVKEQPQKITSLSIFILICNAKNFVVSKYVIEYFHSKLQEYLDVTANTGVTDNFNNIKSILKFLCCLSPIIDNFGVVNVLRQFIALAIDLNKQGCTMLAQEIYYNTLITVPYLFTNETNIELIPKVNELLDLAQDFAVETTDNSLNFHFDSKFNNVAIPYTSKSLGELILPSLKRLQQGQWSDLKALFIDYIPLITPIIDDALAKNKLSNEILKHLLPQLSISVNDIKEYVPQAHTVDFLWQRPRYVFQVYNNLQGFETLPDSESYLNLFFKDICGDLLTNLSFNKNEIAVQLSILDLYFNPKLFSPPGSSIDTLTLVNNDNLSGENTPALSTWKIEDVVVENVLSHIFQLPESLDLPIHYYTVLIACCKENPEAIAPVFGRAIRFFYRNLVSMDFETKIRFMDWMSIQMSNFDFSWKWDEWVDDSKLLSKTMYHPQRSFIKNLITKEVLLSSKRRIKESFVTVQDGQVIELDEFDQYLNLNLVANDSKFQINFDSNLFGAKPEVKELVAKLVFEKKESIKLSTSPQLEMCYIWNNTNLPFFPNFDKLHKFLLANNRSNKQFYEMWTEFTEEINDESIDKPKFVMTFLYQAYCHIGARSIYSTISILKRDLTKLKWLSGVQLGEDDYKGSYGDFRFPELEITDVQALHFNIIDAIFRLWFHQPQFVFLILEFLAGVGIISVRSYVTKCFQFEQNLMITSSVCFESVNRTITKTDVPVVLGLIADKLTKILQILDINPENQVEIESFTADQTDDESLMAKVDHQWLFFEYVGLFKYYLRHFGKTGAEEVVEGIENIKLREELKVYVAQL